MLEPEYIRELLDYNHLTGVFIWRVQHGFSLPGTPATKHLVGGGETILIDRLTRSANQIAWMHHYGEQPNSAVARIDRSKGAIISNLKQTSRKFRLLPSPRWFNAKRCIAYTNYQSGSNAIMVDNGENSVIVQGYLNQPTSRRIEKNELNPAVVVKAVDFFSSYKINGFVTVL